MDTAKKFLWRSIRATRTIALAGAIYHSGYTSGMVDYATDPHGTEKALMVNMIKSQKADKVHTPSSDMHVKAERVGSRIVTAAKLYTKKKLIISSENVAKLQGKGSNLTNNEKPNDKLNSALEEEEKWRRASIVMNGEWEYIVTNAPSVNAFVCDLCPRRIFMHEGLFTICNPTDDELALILSHEVSHAILGHTKARSELHSNVSMGALFLMTIMDPSGFGSVVFDYLILTVGKYLELEYSRETEEEADELGIHIAALACYDTHNGAKIFDKFSNLQGHHATGWNDTHPSSDSR